MNQKIILSFVLFLAVLFFLPFFVLAENSVNLSGNINSTLQIGASSILLSVGGVNYTFPNTPWNYTQTTDFLMEYSYNQSVLYVFNETPKVNLSELRINITNISVNVVLNASQLNFSPIYELQCPSNNLTIQYNNTEVKDLIDILMPQKAELQNCKDTFDKMKSERDTATYITNLTENKINYTYSLVENEHFKTKVYFYFWVGTTIVLILTFVLFFGKGKINVMKGL